MPYVQDIHIDWSHFADHAVIIVVLDDIDQPPKVPLWRKPKPIDWPSQEPPDLEWQHAIHPNTDSDQWYQDIWGDVENYANHVKQRVSQTPLRRDQRGRATTKEVTWQQNTLAPVKPNRKGDVQSHLSCINLTHNRWTKQIRRLQHFARVAQHIQPGISHVEHKANLWRAVRQATGFPQGFVNWRASQPKAYPDSPVQCPFQPPAGPVADLMFHEFLHHYRQLEHSLQQARHTYATLRRAQDPLAIYRDLQKDRAEPVQTIVQTKNFAVTSVDVQAEVAQITLCSPLPPQVASVQVQQIPVAVTRLEDNRLAMPKQAAENLGDTVQISQLVGDVPTILNAFEDEWPLGGKNMMTLITASGNPL